MYLIRQYHVAHIPVTEYIPHDQLDQPLPLVFFYHGWESYTERCATHALELVKQGFRVILPEGYAHGSRRHPDHERGPMDFFKTLKHNVLEFAQLRDYYAAKGLLTDFIGVAGLSMGGITTGMLLTQYPEIAAASSLEGAPGITHLTQALYAKAQASYPDVIAEIGTKRAEELYHSLMTRFDRFDLMNHPEKLASRPLLLWHAQDDPIVPHVFDDTFFREQHETDTGDRLHFISSHAGGHHVPYHASVREAAFFKACLTHTADEDIWSATEQAMRQRFGQHRMQKGGYTVIG